MSERLPGLALVDVLEEDTIMRKLTSVALASVLALGLCAVAQSHHSHAMFDHDQALTLTGTVTNFAFNNPHAFLYIDVTDADGEVVNYWVEMSNIPNMIRRGISPKTFKAGDLVTVSLHPLKDGRPGGNYITVTAADGKTYD